MFFRFRTHARLLFVLLLISTFFSGCASLSEAGSLSLAKASKNTSVIESSSVAAGEARDLAVISLDIDPPLRVLQVGHTATNKFALLAAIDNKGKFTEREIVVRAQLRALPENDVLIERSSVISSLAPGEATTVKFVDLPSIPPRSGYELTVIVEPVPGEGITPNNSQTLPFQLVLSR